MRDRLRRRVQQEGGEEALRIGGETRARQRHTQPEIGFRDGADGGIATQANGHGV